MDIFEMLKNAGVEIPEDKKDSFNTEFRKSYKSEAEVTKKVSAAETDRNSWKKRAEDAEGTLKGFEGKDFDAIQKERDEWREKAEKAENDYREKLYQRDFTDALDLEIANYKFTSEYAKNAVMEEVKAAGLKLVDGKIIGFNDMMESIRGKDAAAFVNEQTEHLEQGAACFTVPLGQKQAGNNGKEAHKPPTLI